MSSIGVISASTAGGGLARPARPRGAALEDRLGARGPDRPLGDGAQGDADVAPGAVGRSSRRRRRQATATTTLRSPAPAACPTLRNRTWRPGTSGIRIADEQLVGRRGRSAGSRSRTRRPGPSARPRGPATTSRASVASRTGACRRPARRSRSCRRACPGSDLRGADRRGRLDQDRQDARDEGERRSSVYVVSAPSTSSPRSSVMPAQLVEPRQVEQRSGGASGPPAISDHEVGAAGDRPQGRSAASSAAPRPARRAGRAGPPSPRRRRGPCRRRTRRAGRGRRSDRGARRPLVRDRLDRLDDLACSRCSGRGCRRSPRGCPASPAAAADVEEARAAISMPGVQIPHWAPPTRGTPAWSGSSAAVGGQALDRPHVAPVHLADRHEAASTSSPSSRTEQAPHSPSPQPSLSGQPEVHAQDVEQAPAAGDRRPRHGARR